MIVICDTSPILYLLLINQLDLLPRLYSTLIIPDVVQAEMQATGAPVVLQEWIAKPPQWLEIRPVPPGNYPPLQRLQAGEQAAIFLAQSLQADLLIVDDLAARQIAQQLGIKITGLLGILGEAARRKWIDFPETLKQLLQATNFRVSPQLVEDLLKEFS
jgi:predicted nucleic acid-binding protein